MTKTRFPEYRIAAFGRRESGKTVLLATLQVNKLGSSDGSTLSYATALEPIGYVRQYISDSGDDRLPEGASADDSNSQYLRNVERLEQGFLPPATDILHGFHRYRFTFTSAKSDDVTRHLSLRLKHNRGVIASHTRSERTAFVDLYDYAGEFFNPATEEKERARELRKLLREADGLIVFAEAPPEDDGETVHPTATDLGSELTGLQTALSLLIEADKEGELNFGHISLIVSKWDRSVGYTLSGRGRAILDEAIECLRADDVTQDQIRAMAERLKSAPWLLDPEWAFSTLTSLDLGNQAQVMAFVEQLRLEFWMANSPSAMAHRNFYQKILNTVGSGSDGAPNVAVFPVSSLGMDLPKRMKTLATTVLGAAGTTVSNIPRPPFQSLNVIEPFHFVLDRREQREVDDARRSVERATSWWKSLLLFFTPIQITRPQVDWTRMQQRVRHDPARSETVSQLRKTTLGAGALRTASLVVVGFLSVSGLQAWQDANFATEMATCDARPECTSGIVNYGNSYLAGERSWMRLFSPFVLKGREAFAAELQQYADRAAEEEKRRLSLDPEQDTTLAEAKAYLDRHGPAGVLSAQASNIISLHALLEAHIIWRGKTEEARNRFQGMGDTCPPLDTIEFDRLIGIFRDAEPADFENHPLYSNGAGKAQAGLQQQALLDLRQAENCAEAQRFSEFQSQVLEALGQNDFTGVLRMLEDSWNKGVSEGQTLVAMTELVERALRTIKDDARAHFLGRVTNVSSDGQWQSAIDNLDLLRKQIDRGLGNTPEFNAIAREASNKLESAASDFAGRWECNAYRGIYKLAQQTTMFEQPAGLELLLNAYENAGHSRQYISQIQSIRQFLERIKQEFHVEITIDHVNYQDLKMWSIWSTIKYSVSISINGIQREIQFDSETPTEEINDKTTYVIRNMPVVFSIPIKFVEEINFTLKENLGQASTVYNGIWRSSIRSSSRENQKILVVLDGHANKSTEPPSTELPFSLRIINPVMLTIMPPNDCN